MLALLLTAAVLHGTPAAAPSKPASTAPAKASPEKAKRPDFELVIPEKMLEDFLVAAMPVKRSVEEELALLGMSQKVTVDITLSRPRVKISPAGVFVTMDYLLEVPGGLAAQGETRPRLDLAVVDGEPLLEGRVRGATIGATGLEVPLDDLVPPLRFPAGAAGPLQVGDAVVEAAVSAREVELESGQARVKGRWSFSKPEPKEKKRPARP